MFGKQGTVKMSLILEIQVCCGCGYEVYCVLGCHHKLVDVY